MLFRKTMLRTKHIITTTGKTHKTNFPMTVITNLHLLFSLFERREFFFSSFFVFFNVLLDFKKVDLTDDPASKSVNIEKDIVIIKTIDKIRVNNSNPFVSLSVSKCR